MTTFVLIHGSYQGGWIWQPVASRLRAAGHKVYAPSLDGCAERKHSLRPGITTETHAVEIADLLFYKICATSRWSGIVDGHPIHARTALVASNAFPRSYEVLSVAHLLH